MVDYDGQFEYLEIIVVNRELQADTFASIVFPNPASHYLNLQNAKGSATVFNAFGQALQQINISADNYRLDLADWKIYYPLFTPW